MTVVGRLPFTTWRRLHRVIEGSDTACVVVASEPLARSVAGITVALSASSALSALKNEPRRVRLFPPLTIEGRVVHARGMRTAHFAVPFDAEDAEDRRGRNAF